MYKILKNKKEISEETNVVSLRMKVKELLGPNLTVLWPNTNKSNKYSNPWTYLKSASGRRILVKKTGPGMCSTAGALVIINNN